MNRRKFLKFLAWLPLAPIAAKIPFTDKVVPGGKPAIIPLNYAPSSSGGALTMEDLVKLTNDYFVSPSNEVHGYEMKGINYDAT